MFLRLLPVILSCVLIAAHMLRSAGLTAALVALLLPLLLFVRRSWVPLVMQGLMALAALEWVRTAWVLMQRRLAEGEPWVRMAVILAAVAAVAAVSVLILRGAAVRRYFASPQGPS